MTSSATGASSKRTSSRFEAEFLAFGAFVAIGIIVPRYPWTTVFVLVATVLTLVAWRSGWFAPARSVRFLVLATPVAAGLFLAFGVLWRQLSHVSPVDRPVWLNLLLYLGVAVCAGVVVWSYRTSTSSPASRLAWYASAALVVVIGIALTSYAVVSDKPAIDVILMHEVAAEELAAGNNPYETMVVPDSNHYAEPGAVLVGYVYPPSTFAAYGGSYLLFGESRWATVAALAAFLILLLAPWRRPVGHQAAARLGLAVMYVSVPQLDVIAARGWTDLLALPFLLGAARLWRRYPVASAIVLGLALSTKQYFVVLLPILLLLDDEFRWKRVGIVGGVVLATYAPFLAAGPEVITYPARTLGDLHRRPDSLGLAFWTEIPRWLSYLVSFGVAALVGLRRGSVARLMLGVAATLAVVFVTGIQAFINYWVVVAGVIAIALAIRVMMIEDETPDELMSSDEGLALQS